MAFINVTFVSVLLSVFRNVQWPNTVIMSTKIIVNCLIDIIVFNVGMAAFNVLHLHTVPNVFLATTFKIFKTVSANVRSVNKIVGNALHPKTVKNV